jgi:hypothetical protein
MGILNLDVTYDGYDADARRAIKDALFMAVVRAANEAVHAGLSRKDAEATILGAVTAERVLRGEC